MVKSVQESVLEHNMRKVREEWERPLRKRIEALEAALRVAGVRCEHVHHTRADQHMIGEPCPVVARIEALTSGDSGRG